MTPDVHPRVKANVIMADIPSLAVQDGEIIINIANLQGEFVPLNDLLIYEVVEGGGGGQSAGVKDRIPKVYSLSPGHPNPFAGETFIQYQLPVKSMVSLKVYNLAGNLFRILEAGNNEAGYYTTRWDGKDDSGRFVTSGIYFLRLTASSGAENFTSTEKVILMK